jgi:hypothetical protein
MKRRWAIGKKKKLGIFILLSDDKTVIFVYPFVLSDDGTVIFASPFVIR